MTMTGPAVLKLCMVPPLQGVAHLTLSCGLHCTGAQFAGWDDKMCTCLLQA